MCLWCSADEAAYPFAFLPRRIARGLIPVLQLVYCRDWRDVVRFAGPIGRHLARRGRPLVLMDAPGPMRGLAGLYFAGSSPKYFKGPAAPRLGDLAFTEAVLFGPWLLRCRLADLLRRLVLRVIAGFRHWQSGVTSGCKPRLHGDAYFRNRFFGHLGLRTRRAGATGPALLSDRYSQRRTRAL